MAETLIDYVANCIDVVQIRQKNGSAYDTIGSFSWNSEHRGLSSTDAAGKTTTNTWNARGQLLGTVGAGSAASVDGPFPSDTITFTYDDLGRANSQRQRNRECDDQHL